MCDTLLYVSALTDDNHAFLGSFLRADNAIDNTTKYNQPPAFCCTLLVLLVLIDISIVILRKCWPPQYYLIHPIIDIPKVHSINAQEQRKHKRHQLQQSKMNTLRFGLLLALSAVTSAFVPFTRPAGFRPAAPLFAEDENKAGPLVSGEELEVLLQGLTQPLVIDAYATW